MLPSRGLALLGGLFFLVPTAQGQDATAAVLRPVAGPDTEAGLVGAVERVLRAKLDELAPLTVTGTPNLELRDLQLAVGCMSEDDACLGSIAEQLGVSAIVVSHVDRAGDALVATITHFDTASGERTNATARAQGENDLLERIDPAVRELFGLPEAERPVGEYERDEPETTRVVVEPSGLSVLPFLVAGAGLAAGGVGVYFALKSRSSQQEYADAPIVTPDDVDAAIDLRDRAESEALLANVLFAVGGGLVALGATLLVIDLASDTETPVVAAPTLSPDGVGLVIASRFGGGS
jgi:hypothetical protein